MLLLNKTVKTVQYPTCISFIENKNKKISKKVLTFGACSDIINIVAERHKQNSDEVWPGSSVG